MDNVFPTNLPIQRGDLIGIDCCAGSRGHLFHGGSTGQRIFFEPGFLGDGATGAMPSGTDNFELLLNADIEPTPFAIHARCRARCGGQQGWS
jgi:hypothetical protein